MVQVLVLGLTQRREGAKLFALSFASLAPLREAFRRALHGVCDVAFSNSSAFGFSTNAAVRLFSDSSFLNSEASYRKRLAISG